MKDARHHPKIETLADFAAGRLDEARAVVIATHAAFCEQCAAQIDEFEAIGGAVMETAEPVAMADDALERVLARADASANVVFRDQPASDTRSDLPEDRLPVSAYLKGSIDDVDWRAVAPGISQHVIEAEGYRPGVLRLLKIEPGVKMLAHSHQGDELTLILRGAYRDDIGEFGVGDLADLDGEHTHQPEAIGDEPCICLIATSAPLRFTTMLGRIAQPFVGM
ncbi:MAG: ChrR family anti-sigma-E factor [Pseudomonadota bacterium]